MKKAIKPVLNNIYNAGKLITKPEENIGYAIRIKNNSRKYIRLS
jgi:hypothetical protein